MPDGPDKIGEMLTIIETARSQNYTSADKYADFRRVFLGSPEGHRVLYEILGWAHQWHSSFMHNSPVEQTIFREGERNIGLKLMATIQVEPKERPPQPKDKR